MSVPITKYLLETDIHKELHNIHFCMEERNKKPILFKVYVFTEAEVVNKDAKNVKVPLKGKINEHEEPKENELDYEECLSCQ